MQKYVKFCGSWAAICAISVAALAIVIVGTGPTPITGPWDVFILLDEAWRILCGQVPHTDFHNPIGPLTYSLVAAGMKISGLSLTGYVYGNVIFLIAAAAWGGAVFFGRLSAGYAFLTTLFIAVLAVATRPLGFEPHVNTYAMIYNRYGWVLLSILLVQLFVTGEKESRARSNFDALSAGLLLGLLLFCKINFFAIGFGALALGLIVRRDVRTRAALTAAGFGLVCLGAWAALGVNPLNYAHDVLTAGRSQSVSGRFWGGVEIFIENLWQIGLAGVVWLFLAVLPAWQKRVSWPAALRVTVVYWFILASAILIAMGNSHEHLDIPLYFIAGIILLHETARTHTQSLAAVLRLENWKYASAAAIVIVVFFGNIFSRDVMAIKHSVAAIAFENEAAPRFASDRLHDFVIPRRPLRPTAYWRADRLPERINEGLALIRRNVGREDSIAVIALTDPFSFALGLEPPKGTMEWWDYNLSFNRKTHPDPETQFANAAFVLIPVLRDSDQGCCQKTVRVLLDIYGPYLKQHFREVRRSRSWILLKARRGKG